MEKPFASMAVDGVLGNRERVRVRDAQPLGRREEKQPVGQYGTRQRGAVLELLVRRLRPGQGVGRGQALVAVEEESGAGEGIRPRARRDVDDAARRAAKLGRVGRSDHLVLEHGLLRDRRPEGADGRVVVVEAVELHVVQPRVLPVDRDPRGGRGAGLRPAVERDTRSRQGEVEEVSAVDREVADLGLCDGALEPCRDQIRGRRGRPDGDRFLDPRHRQGQAERRRRSHDDRDSGDAERLESFPRRRHVVGAGGQKSQGELAAAARDGGS